MAKRNKKSPLSFDFFDDLAPPFEESPFKKALKQYFSDRHAATSQKELKKEMQLLRKALSEMDEAKMAHNVMERSRRKLLNAYQELLEKSKA